MHFSFYKQTPLIKGEKNRLFSVYRDANVWPKAGVEDPALGQMSNFFGSAFYIDTINTNLNKNFHT